MIESQRKGYDIALCTTIRWFELSYCVGAGRILLLIIWNTVSDSYNEFYNKSGEPIQMQLDLTQDVAELEQMAKNKKKAA